MISERSSVRSVALGFWIGAGSRDEKDDRAGVSHFIEHLLFKGSAVATTRRRSRRPSTRWARELNAATSREHTVVYCRVPDRHVETALDVMADMVFAPAFAELDQEREVVLEEIAMYEDTPQELVHDLFSEAVFGDARARPARDRHRRGDLDGQPPRDRAPTTASMYARREHRRLRRRGTSTHDELVALLAAGRAASERRAPRARTCAGRSCRTPPPGLRFQRKDTEQYHLCLGAPGHLALRPAPLRRVAARLDPRRLGLVAPLPGDPREARDGVLRSTRFASQYTDTGLIGIYVGTREENLAACVEICVEQIADIAAGKLRDGRARAREGEPEGADHALDGVDVEPDEPARQVADRRHRAADVRADHRGDRRGRRARQVAELAAVLLAPERLSASGVGPDEAQFRERRRAREPGLVARAAA